VTAWTSEQTLNDAQAVKMHPTVHLFVNGVIGRIMLTVLIAKECECTTKVRILNLCVSVQITLCISAGKGVELSEEDMEFARLIFLDELRRRDDEIEQMYRRRHGKGPINTILEMDYTRFPPERTFLDGRLGEEPGGPTLHAKAPWGSSFVDIYVDPLRRKL
jgi:hypothetical protein